MVKGVKSRKVDGKDEREAKLFLLLEGNSLSLGCIDGFSHSLRTILNASAPTMLFEIHLIAMIGFQK